MRQTKNNEPLGSARLEAAEPDRAACPTLGSVERSGFGFDDLLREQKHLDHPLAGVHGEYLKLIGRQRVQPLLERRRAFQCIFEAMGLGVVVNRLVVRGPRYRDTAPLPRGSMRHCVMESQIFVAHLHSLLSIGGSHAQAHQFCNRCDNIGFGYDFLVQSQCCRNQCQRCSANG